MFNVKATRAFLNEQILRFAEKGNWIYDPQRGMAEESYRNGFRSGRRIIVNDKISLMSMIQFFFRKNERYKAIKLSNQTSRYNSKSH